MKKAWTALILVLLICNPVFAKNNKLKVVYWDTTKAKNYKIFPTITKKGSADFVKVKSLKKKYINQLLDKNSYVLIIRPLGIEKKTETKSEDQVSSQYIVGTRMVSNPQYAKLTDDMRFSEQGMEQAQRDWNYSKRQHSKCMGSTSWYCIGAMTGALAAMNKHQNTYDRHKSRYQSARAQLMETPRKIKEGDYRDYTYNMKTIISTKKGWYQIIEYKNGKFREKGLPVGSKKTFKVASGINKDDRNYSNLIKVFSTPNKIKQWEGQQLKSMSSSDLVKKISKRKYVSEIKINNKEDLYKALNVGGLVFTWKWYYLLILPLIFGVFPALYKLQRRPIPGVNRPSTKDINSSTKDTKKIRKADGDLVNKLTDLKKLYKDGTLTKAEFQKAKKRLID